LLPKEYKWEYQGEKRGKKKGRAAGGIITGVKLGIKEKRQQKEEEEECMERNIHIGNKCWKIMTIYSKEMKTTRTGVEDTITENRETCMLMGRDFNGRI
jgi:protein subunit release factor B